LKAKLNTPVLGDKKDKHNNINLHIQNEEKPQPLE